jgi:hypothetical protein
MPGGQFDPNQSLSLMYARHVELLGEAAHQRLVKAAMQQAASRTQFQPRAPHGGLSRGLALALATVRRGMSFAAVESSRG